MSNRFNPTARRRARRFALQAIYQWQLSGDDLSEIERQFFMANSDVKFDTEYFRELLHGIPAHLSTLDNYMSDFLDRPANQLDPIELAILRIGIYEFTQRLDVPYRVVINEALELAKIFGAEDGHKYVNGILDQVARRIRTIEISKEGS